jgi:putative transposase
VSVFIDEHRERFGVEPICQTLDVSASAYYQRATGERSDRAVEDERLTGRIREVHGANYECYGYRRVHAQLVGEGEAAGRDQVARLMASHGIQGAKRRGKPWRTTIGNIPPAEYEQRYAQAVATHPETVASSPNSVLTLSASAMYDPFGVVSDLR